MGSVGEIIGEYFLLELNSHSDVDALVQVLPLVLHSCSSSERRTPSSFGESSDNEERSGDCSDFSVASYTNRS